MNQVGLVEILNEWEPVAWFLRAGDSSVYLSK